MEENKIGVVSLYVESETCSLDREIMRHIASEVARLLRDGLSDLDEYGSGDGFRVGCSLLFAKKEDK